MERGHWVLPLLVCVLRACPRIGEVLALRPEDIDVSTGGRETLRIARRPADHALCRYGRTAGG